MKTETVNTKPPAELVAEVRRLKQYFPYRICWGAWNPANPSETFQGADTDRRKLNARLRMGWLAFIA